MAIDLLTNGELDRSKVIAEIKRITWDMYGESAGKEVIRAQDDLINLMDEVQHHAFNDGNDTGQGF